MAMTKKKRAAALKSFLRNNPSVKKAKRGKVSLRKFTGTITKTRHGLLIRGRRKK